MTPSSRRKGAGRRPDDLHGDPFASAVATYTCAVCGDLHLSAAAATTWLSFVRAGAAFYTSVAWPLVASAFVRLGRDPEFLDCTAAIRARTPWLDSARSIAAGDLVNAQAILETIGGGAIARFITADMHRGR